MEAFAGVSERNKRRTEAQRCTNVEPNMTPGFVLLMHVMNTFLGSRGYVLAKLASAATVTSDPEKYAGSRSK